MGVDPPFKMSGSTPQQTADVPFFIQASASRLTTFIKTKCPLAKYQVLEYPRMRKKRKRR